MGQFERPQRVESGRTMGYSAHGRPGSGFMKSEVALLGQSGHNTGSEPVSVGQEGEARIRHANRPKRPMPVRQREKIQVLP